MILIWRCASRTGLVSGAGIPLETFQYLFMHCAALESESSKAKASCSWIALIFQFPACSSPHMHWNVRRIIGSGD